MTTVSPSLVMKSHEIELLECAGGSRSDRDESPEGRGGVAHGRCDPKQLLGRRGMGFGTTSL